MSDYFCNETDHLSESEKREIYEYEYNKPLIIEQEIKNKNIQMLRDDILIYASRVENILEHKIYFGKSDGLTNMIYFLKIAVESNNLHVLKTVWIYGIEKYFISSPWESSDILMFVADLIRGRAPYKTLNFFVKQLKTDDKYCLIETKTQENPYSGLKRYYAFGNLLCAAVYYNNIEAVNLLIPKQPENQESSFSSLAENIYLKNINDMNNNMNSGNLMFAGSCKNRLETLFSNNPIFYAFDNGNIEALETLIKNGYKIDFTALDFTYQLANFAHRNTINFLIKNYRDELFNTLSINEILKSSNYPLLRFYTKNEKLKSEDFNKIFSFNDEFQFDKYKKIRLSSIKKCIAEFTKQDIKINDIDNFLKYSVFMSDMELLNLCLNLYCSNNDHLDITSLLSCSYLKKDLLQHMSSRIKLVCNADESSKMLYLNIRDFQYYLKYINFIFNDLTTLNELTKHILDFNSVTGIKLLIKNKFITSKNYSQAVDYIINNDSDKLITTLIAYSKELGGSKKSYGI